MAARLKVARMEVAAADELMEADRQRSAELEAARAAAEQVRRVPLLAAGCCSAHAVV